MLDAIFALPTFERRDNDATPPHLRQDPKMGQEMVIKLILEKIKLVDDPRRPRPLCYEIRSTVDYLVDNSYVDNDSRSEYMAALAKAAAMAGPLWNITENLRPSLNRYLRPLCTYMAKISSNALAAAAGANQPHVVSKLLTHKADPEVKPMLFEHAIAIAAASGFEDVVQLLLLKMSPLMTSQTFIQLRLFRALYVAAEAGHVRVIEILLECLPRLPKYNSFMDRAVFGAIQNGWESAAILLLQQRSPSPKTMGFWNEVVRVAAKRNCLEVLKFVIDERCDSRTWEESATSTPTLDANSDYSIPPVHYVWGEGLEIAIEEACRHGQVKAVKILLPKFVDCEPTTSYYSNILFWAARNGNLELVDLLMSFVPDWLDALPKVLAGAGSVKNQQMMRHIFQKYGPNRPNQSPDLPSFSTAIHCLYPDLPARLCNDGTEPRGSSSGDMVANRQDILGDCADFGDLHDFVQNFCRYGHEISLDELLRISGPGFCSAARCNHFDILLYLCENLPPTGLIRILEAKEAGLPTAALSILADLGWNIDRTLATDYRDTQEDNFSNMRLIEFCLELGANPNAWIGESTSTGTLTVMSIAIAYSSPLIINLLFRAGGTLEGAQPLHAAAMRKDNLEALEIIELLLDMGFDGDINKIMFKDDDEIWKSYKFQGSSTPIFKAVESGKVGIVKYLLERGADARIREERYREEDGMNLGDVIEDVAGGYPDVVEVLEKAGMVDKEWYEEWQERQMVGSVSSESASSTL
ncbi:ankyrin [Amniculicola lignicola CBS 123094]|uniref:Ankyrin n=1 Tax=Amniculicola lignicola CBS 123094 TaxID=1392246 RepID=A0A6A5X158_9PLEO|nr:ankyrin [Amniculicola lignicola CBS 123094]